MGVFYCIFYKRARCDLVRKGSGLFEKWPKVKNHVLVCDGMLMDIGVWCGRVKMWK